MNLSYKYRIKPTLTQARMLEEQLNLCRHARAGYCLIPQNHPSFINGVTHLSSMSQDEVKGKAKKIKGQIREEVGKVTDNKTDQLKGKIEQVKGKAQEEIGKVKRKAKG